MNQEQLESLPYPMFETTEDEKELLEQMIGYHTRTHLCNRLKKHADNVATDNHWRKTMRLINKIETAMYFESTLENWLTEFHIPTQSLYQYEEHGALVRDIWIRKLLAYSPE